MNSDYSITNSCSLREQKLNEVFPSSTKITVYIVLTCSILLLCDIASVWLLMHLVPSKLAITIILIIMHLYIIRELLLLCVFPGRNKLIMIYLNVLQARIDSLLFLEIISKTKYQLNQMMHDSNHKKGDIVLLKRFYDYIESKYLIFEAMKHKYDDLGSYSNNFHHQLKLAFNLLSQSKIVQICELKEDSNEIIDLTKDDKKDIEVIVKELDSIIALIKEYRLEYKCGFNIFRYFKNRFFNNIFYKKEYVRMKALINYKYEDFFVLSKDNIKIDCVLITKEDENINEKKPIMIMCCPNLILLEHLIESWNLNALYLSNHIDVLLWNYRGYGFSEGSTDFKKVNKDIESIYDFLKTKNRWSRIGIHGISIGGIPACHLANIRPIDLLIADRTFGSFDKLLSSLCSGNFIFYLFKLLCIFTVSNTHNYLNAKCFKIILSDPNDNTITESISLKSAISQSLIDKINIRKLEIQNTSNTLLIKNNSNNKTNSLIDSALNQFNQEKFYQSVLKIHSFMKEYIYNKEKAYQLKSGPNNNSYMPIELITNEQYEPKFSDALYNRIKFLMLGLESTGLFLESILNSNKPKDFIQIFFNNFAVWGLKNNMVKSKNCCLCFSSTENGEKNLNYFIQGLESIANNNEFQQYKKYEIFKILIEFIKGIKSIGNYMSKFYNNEMVSGLKGQLVILSCGHTSFYYENEIETLKYLLLKNFN